MVKYGFFQLILHRKNEKGKYGEEKKQEIQV